MVPLRRSRHGYRLSVGQLSSAGAPPVPVPDRRREHRMRRALPARGRI